MVDFPCEIPLAEVGAADVLFCRGKSVHSHKGNIAYREMVRERASKYQSPESNMFDRDTIAREVLQLVHDSSGRFLCPSQENQSAAWFECPPRIARIKVKQALRDIHVSGGRLKKSKLKPPPTKQEVKETKLGNMGVVAAGNALDQTSPMHNTNCTLLMQVPLIIGERMEQEGMRSDKSTDNCAWEEIQELCSGRSYYAVPPISYGVPNWFSCATRSFSQVPALHDRVNAIPLLPKSTRPSSRDLATASLRISYMELLRGQTSSRLSLDSETIEILRRIRDS